MQVWILNFCEIFVSAFQCYSASRNNVTIVCHNLGYRSTSAFKNKLLAISQTQGCFGHRQDNPSTIFKDRHAITI